MDSNSMEDAFYDAETDLLVFECHAATFNSYMATGVQGRTREETRRNQRDLRYVARWLCLHGHPTDPLDWGLVWRHSGLNY